MRVYGRKTAYVNTAIIIINVLCFLYLELQGSTENAGFMLAHGAMFAPLVVDHGQYYRLVTSVFMHFGVSHLMNNMLVLFVLGDNLERALGHVKYLIFYLLCGVGANLVSMTVNLMMGSLSGMKHLQMDWKTASLMELEKTCQSV